MTLRLLCVAVVVVCTGCPGSTGGNGGGGGGSGGGSGAGGGSGGGSSGGGSSGGGISGPVPLSQLCTQVLNADCDYFVRCGGFDSKANCVTEFGQLLSSGGSCALPQLGAIDAGRITYDGAAAAQCLNDLASSSCAGGSPVPTTACQMTFVGTVGANGACNDTSECLTSLYCDTGGLSCGGTCKQRIAVGQPVPQNGECVMGAQNVGDVCVAELPLGANCDPMDGGIESLPCARPAQCQYQPLPGGGSRRFCAVPATPGLPCDNADAGMFGCGSFSQCDINTNLCVAAGGVDAGCGLDTNAQCKLDLWCNQAAANPVCLPASDLGGPCLFDGSCKAGICDGGMIGLTSKLGTCVGLPGLNDPCSGTCATGLFCDEATHRCQMLKANGAPCVQGSQCLAHTCSFVDAGQGLCGPCP